MAVSALKNVSQCSTKNEDGVSEGKEEGDRLSAEVESANFALKRRTK